MVSRVETYPIDPGATLDYWIDLSDWLSPDETVVSYEVTVGGAVLESHSEAEGIITAWITPADARQATINYAFTTSQGRTDERTRLVPIRDR